MDLQSEAVLKLEAALSRALAPAPLPAEPSRTRAVTSQMLLICCWRTMKEVSDMPSRHLPPLSVQFLAKSDLCCRRALKPQ